MKKIRYFKKIFFVMLCCILVSMMFSVAASADSNLKVVVMQNGQPLSENSYSTSQLSAFGSSQAVYSSFDSSGSPELISAKGVKISALLSGLKINPADVESLHFCSSDGWDRTFTKKFLLDTPRYTFSGVVAAKTESDGTVSYDQNLITSQSVESMLALQSYTERNATAENFGSVSTTDGTRICFGQQTYDEVVSTKYGKHINKIEIVLNSGAVYEGGGTDNEQNTENENQNNDEDDGQKQNTYNGSLPDSLTITVGYYGQEFVEKKVFSAAEMKSMANYKQAYTYIDSMPAVCVSSAYGIKVTDLLAAAGIDINSVEKLTFRCMDGYGGVYGKTLTKSTLLDTNRYFFPNLPSHWDFDTGAVTAGATAGALRVEPMIAVTENWNRFTRKSDFSQVTDFNNQTDKYRYRILTGQSYGELTKSTASEASCWIYKIEVQLGGTGQDTVANTDVDTNQKVGSELTTDFGNGKLVQLTDEQTTGIENAIAMQQKDGAGVQKWRVYEMDEDAVALDNIILDNPWTPYIIGFLIFCFIAGGAAKYVVFRRQMGKGLLK